MGNTFTSGIDIYAWDKTKGNKQLFFCLLVLFSIFKTLLVQGITLPKNQEGNKKARTLETLRKYKSGELNLPCVLDELTEDVDPVESSSIVDPFEFELIKKKLEVMTQTKNEIEKKCVQLETEKGQLRKRVVELEGKLHAKK